MLEFQEKRKIKRLIYSKLTLVVLIIIIALLLNAVWGVYQKQSLAKDNLNKTAAVFEGLQAREKMLSSEIESLKTEVGVEAEIREKYGLVKPGEEVIVVVDKETDSGSSTPASTDSSGFWQDVLNLFR
jgi:cell division protein FtsB